MDIKPEILSLQRQAKKEVMHLKNSKTLQIELNVIFGCSSKRLWSNGDDDDDDDRRRTRRTKDKVIIFGGSLVAGGVHAFGVEQVSLLFFFFVLFARVDSSRGEMFERKPREFERVFLDVLSDASVADIQL